MKLKFKTQAYQTAAVQAEVDCFKGQPRITVVFATVLTQVPQRKQRQPNKRR